MRINGKCNNSQAPSTSIRPHQIHFKILIQILVKNSGGWEVYIFIFPTALKNRTVLKETFNNFILNFQRE